MNLSPQQNMPLESQKVRKLYCYKDEHHVCVEKLGSGEGGVKETPSNFRSQEIAGFSVFVSINTLRILGLTEYIIFVPNISPLQPRQKNRQISAHNTGKFVLYSIAV